MRTGWKICDCSTWRREDPKRWILGSFQYLKLSKGWVSRWWGQTLLGGAQQLNKGQRSQNGIQFHLSIRNKLITLRVMEHWRKLPRSVVASPFLEILKTSLEAFLAIYCREYFFFCRDWTRQSPEVSFLWFCDSWNSVWFEGRNPVFFFFRGKMTEKKKKGSYIKSSETLGANFYLATLVLKVPGSLIMVQEHDF